MQYRQLAERKLGTGISKQSKGSDKQACSKKVQRGSSKKEQVGIGQLVGRQTVVRKFEGGSRKQDISEKAAKAGSRQYCICLGSTTP